MSSKHTETQNYFDMYNNLGDQKAYIEKVKSLLVSCFFRFCANACSVLCLCVKQKSETYSSI